MRIIRMCICCKHFYKTSFSSPPRLCGPPEKRCGVGLLLGTRGPSWFTKSCSLPRKAEGKATLMDWSWLMMAERLLALFPGISCTACPAEGLVEPRLYLVVACNVSSHACLKTKGVSSAWGFLNWTSKQYIWTLQISTRYKAIWKETKLLHPGLLTLCICDGNWPLGWRQSRRGYRPASLQPQETNLNILWL